MAEVLSDSVDQSLQHFLTHSSWDEAAVIDQIVHDADQLIGGKPDSCLLIDETCYPKRGNKSDGVARQWCGRLGKVDNCQSGVFAVLGCRTHCVPFDFHLFLPEEAIEFNRKHDLALQMVISTRSRGVRFNWIGRDSFYGEDPSFLRSLDQMHEIFMADVNKDQHIYLQDPDPIGPPAKSKHGRKPSRLKAQTEPMRIDQWVQQPPDDAWRRLTIREPTKGKLQVDILHQRVWLWDGKEKQAKHYHMALVMMAMLFILEQRLSYKGSHPLLSCQDIISLLCNFLPKRSITSEEVLRQLEVRHQKRKASIQSAYRKQRQNSLLNRTNTSDKVEVKYVK